MWQGDAAQARRVAIVTGSSAGLGREIARRFGGLGWAVAVGARREERLQQAAAEVIAAGGEGLAHPLDVTDSVSVDAFFDAAEQTLGAIDVVVNNAAVGWPGPIHGQPSARIKATIETNLLGPLFVTRRAVESMLARGAGGDIVFVTSEAAAHPWPHMLPYGCTKAALEYLAIGLDAELEGTGIRVAAVRLGPSVSDWNLSWTPEEIQDALQVWQRFGVLRNFDYLEPATVADAVVMAVTAPRGTKLNMLTVRPEAPPPDAPYAGDTAIDQGRSRSR